MRSRFFILVAAGLLASTALAHRPIETSIKGELFLTESVLRHEISTAHFLFTPTQGAGNQSDSTALRHAITGHMAKHYPVTIDGIRVPPTISTGYCRCVGRMAHHCGRHACVFLQLC